MHLYKRFKERPYGPFEFVSRMFLQNFKNKQQLTLSISLNTFGE